MEKKRSIIKLLAVLLAVAAFATAGFLLGRFLPNKDRDKTNAALEHVGRAVEIQCGAKTGTGFIYESDGETATVLTCYHVVKGDAKSARFRFYGDSAFKYAEKTLGFDENADLAVFKDVYIDYGVPTWLDGEIDIAPEVLYEKSVPAESPRVS